jgi:hypothetical protein
MVDIGDRFYLNPENGSVEVYVLGESVYTIVKKSDDVWELIIEPREALSPEILGETE